VAYVVGPSDIDERFACFSPAERLLSLVWCEFRLAAKPDTFAFAPTLRPDDIVIIDNLGSHKGPIEQVFAKLKHLLRKAAARTVEAVCAAIGEVLAAFTPQECANYLRNSGYAPT
jgi:transposase